MLVLYDCDEFTREWGRQQGGLQDPDFVPLQVPHLERPYQPTMTVPPNILGTIPPLIHTRSNPRQVAFLRLHAIRVLETAEGTSLSYKAVRRCSCRPSPSLKTFSEFPTLFGQTARHL